MLVSRRTSLIISNSLPSPPPGDETPSSISHVLSDEKGLRITVGSVPCSLLSSLINAGHDTELPVRKVIQVDMER